MMRLWFKQKPTEIEEAEPVVEAPQATADRLAPELKVLESFASAPPLLGLLEGEFFQYQVLNISPGRITIKRFVEDPDPDPDQDWFTNLYAVPIGSELYEAMSLLEKSLVDREMDSYSSASPRTVLFRNGVYGATGPYISGTVVYDPQGSNDGV